MANVFTKPETNVFIAQTISIETVSQAFSMMDADEFAFYVRNNDAGGSSFDVVVEHNGIKNIPTTHWIQISSTNIPDQLMLYDIESNIFFREIRFKITNITGNPIVNLVLIKRNLQYFQQKGGVT